MKRIFRIITGTRVTFVTHFCYFVFTLQYSSYYIHVGKTTNQITEPMSKLFQGKNLAFVSTLMKDGSPQVTPTWVDIEDGNIIVNTAEGRLKHKNISRDPRIAISLL